MSGMRLVNRLLAVLAALAVIAVGVLIPVEIVRAALGTEHWLLPWESWTADLTRNSWQAGPVRAVLFTTAAVGLLLLLTQLRPRRPSVLPLAPLTPNVAASTTRRSLQQTLQRAATEVDGVAAARVRVGRRTATVTAAAQVRDPAGLREQVTEHVRQRLEGLALARSPRLSVRVRGKESR